MVQGGKERGMFEAMPRQAGLDANQMSSLEEDAQFGYVA